jgi:hypothetical protein
MIFSLMVFRLNATHRSLLQELDIFLSPVSRGGSARYRTENRDRKRTRKYAMPRRC